MSDISVDPLINQPVGDRLAVLTNQLVDSLRPLIRNHTNERPTMDYFVCPRDGSCGYKINAMSFEHAAQIYALEVQLADDIQAAFVSSHWMNEVFGDILLESEPDDLPESLSPLIDLYQHTATKAQMREIRHQLFQYALEHPLDIHCQQWWLKYIDDLASHNDHVSFISNIIEL